VGLQCCGWRVVLGGVATIAGYVVRDWRSVLGSGGSSLLQVQAESGAQQFS